MPKQEVQVVEMGGEFRSVIIPSGLKGKDRESAIARAFQQDVRFGKGKSFNSREEAEAFGKKTLASSSERNRRSILGGLFSGFTGKK